MEIFELEYEKQLKKAIDKDDKKLLQVLLGPKYCQLWRYWLMYAILTHDILIITNRLKYKLPIEVVKKRYEILNQQFRLEEKAKEKQKYQATSKEVNRVIKNVEQKIIESYKVLDNREGQEIFTICGKKVSNGGEGRVNDSIKKLIKKLEIESELKHVLNLDLSYNYEELYQSVLKEVSDKAIKEGDEIYREAETLTAKKEQLIKESEKVNVVIKVTEEIIKKIKKEKFTNEMYEYLLRDVLENRAFLYGKTEDNIEKIKKNLKLNCDYKLANRLLEYAVSNNKEPSIWIIKVLIANGASLINSCISDSETNRSMTVKEYFENHLKGEYESVAHKSIYTIMKDVNKLLFDFPIMDGEVDIVNIISSVPNKNGEFSKDPTRANIFNKVGKGKEFMDMLEGCINEYVNKKTTSPAKAMWLKKMLKIFESSNKEIEEKDYNEGYEKLYESLDIGYLSIVTGDGGVIVDYIREIKREAEESKNMFLRGLYDSFLNILKCEEIRNQLLWNRCYIYIIRTLKSYTWEWSEAWEKKLTGP